MKLEAARSSFYFHGALALNNLSSELQIENSPSKNKNFTEETLIEEILLASCLLDAAHKISSIYIYLHLFCIPLNKMQILNL